jgi:hypothetical protein
VLNALIGNRLINKRSNNIALLIASIVKLLVLKFALNCTIPNIIASIRRDYYSRLIDAVGS